MKYLGLLFLALFIHSGKGLSTRQVALPLKPLQNTETDFQQLKSAFQDVVDSSEFFVQTGPSENEKIICSVPALGSGIKVTFQPDDRTISSDFVLSVEASGREEFGWICVAFYENKALFQDMVDTSNLYEAVVDHYNQQPPHPGFEANSAILAGSHKIEDLFEEGAMSELEKNGFLILGNGPKSTEHGHQKLSKYLVAKTNQGENVRTDTVHFLDRDEATLCGFEEVRTCLNKRFAFISSSHIHSFLSHEQYVFFYKSIMTP